MESLGLSQKDAQFMNK